MTDGVLSAGFAAIVVSVSGDVRGALPLESLRAHLSARRRSRTADCGSNALVATNRMIRT
jgi:hypothetical protein